MTLSAGKKYTCYVLQDVMTDSGLLENNNARNHTSAAIWFSPFYFRDIPSVELEGKLYFCQRKEKIASNLLALGVPIETIMQASGLSEEEIKNIQ